MIRMPAGLMLYAMALSAMLQWRAAPGDPLRPPQHLPSPPAGAHALAGSGDSVSVLMFSSFTLARVRLNTECAWLVNGRDVREHSLTIAAASDGLRVNGRRVAACEARPAASRIIRIEGGGREKSIRGRITITAERGRLKLIGHMAERDYLAATLTSEAMPSDPMEYLTALSVVQRNYLRFHRPRHLPDAEMCDNTHCQLVNLKEGWERVYAAVDRASHLELTAEGGLPCYYSVACGGSTLTPAQIWNRSEPGYSNVTCTYCRRCSRYRWTRTFKATREVDAILRTAPAAPCVDDDLRIALGRAAGFNNVLSNTFERIERHGTMYVIAGRGFGHRIGLCQEGARELARHGWSAQRILAYYFPAAQLRFNSRATPRTSRDPR
ncbi:MAG TPA: SpoIID/LytB domain-containing protein [Candidatus Kapabacteria bacterium]|nr:SpoIID/LytB domain-containing protein [Candidatus Kapabacteria bacterium]